jgi:hypothetical protein
VSVDVAFDPALSRAFAGAHTATLGRAHVETVAPPDALAFVRAVFGSISCSVAGPHIRAYFAADARSYAQTDAEA